MNKGWQRSKQKPPRDPVWGAHVATASLDDVENSLDQAFGQKAKRQKKPRFAFVYGKTKWKEGRIHLH